MLSHMIIVEKEAKGSGRAAHRYARSVAQYLQSAKRNDAGAEYGIKLAAYLPGQKTVDAGEERVLALGARTQHRAIDWDQAMAELERRLAKRSSRSKKPARHAIMSLREGEQLEPEQCDEAVRVLAEELGSQQGLVMWALHGDTNNQHLHLLILTLDADGKATEYGHRGQSHEAMQRAIARLEHAFDLQPEQRARYEADDRGVRRKPVVETPAKKRAPIESHVLQWEAETGLQSFTRFAQDVLAPHLETATSWEEAQAKLAEHGAMVLKAGSGGEIRSSDMLYKVKLTNVDRTLRWAALIERWGDWVEPARPQQQYEPKVLNPRAALGWVAHNERRAPARAGVQARIAQLRAQRAAEVARLEEEYSARSADLTAALMEHRNLPGGALRSALRGIYSSRFTTVKAEFDHRIAALCALRGEVDDAPSLDCIDVAAIGAPDFSFEIAWPQAPPGTLEPAGFRAELVGSSVQYWSIIEPARRPAFVERCNRIWMVDQSDAALIAALTVAQARYGVVAAHGDAAFIRRAQQVGRALGLEVQDGRCHQQAERPRPSLPSRTAHWQQRLLAVRTGMIARVRLRLLDSLMNSNAGFDERRDDLPPQPGRDHRVDRSLAQLPGVQLSPLLPPATVGAVTDDRAEFPASGEPSRRRSGKGGPTPERPTYGAPMPDLSQ